MTQPTNGTPEPVEPAAQDQSQQEWLGETQVTAVDLAKANSAVANAILTLGIITGIFGLIMLFWPGATVRVVAILFGIWLVISGLILLAQAFAAAVPGGMKVLLGIGGVLSVIIGGVCIFNSSASVKILVLFVLIGWLANGLANLIVGLREKDSANRGAYLFVGIVQIVLAILVIAWPSATVTVIVRVIGIGLLITAALEIWISTKVRKNGPDGQVVVVSQ